MAACPAHDAYYETIDLIDACHPQTILAYGLNGKPLPVEQRRADARPHRAPARLQACRNIVHTIELVDSFADVGGGQGGYWEDNGYDWYGGI